MSWMLTIVWIGATAGWSADDWYDSYDECISAGVELANAAESIICEPADTSAP